MLRGSVSTVDTVDRIRELTEAPAVAPSSRLSEVLRDWKWNPLSRSRYRTPFGNVDLLYDGEQTIKMAMRMSWEATFWQKEPRAGM